MKEFPAFTALFLQPGTTLPATLKVTLPATVATTVMFFAWRNSKLPDGTVSETLAEPEEIVIVVAVDVCTK